MLSCSPIDLVDLSLREYCWMRHEGALLSLVAEIGNQKVLDRTSTELMNIGKFENYRCFDRTSRDSLTFCWSSLPSLGLRIPNIPGTMTNQTPSLLTPLVLRGWGVLHKFYLRW